MATRLHFSAGGIDGAFTALVGTVIATERRSDARVTGGGYTTSVNGQIFGKTNVTTDVVVTRDIFLRDAEGQEHHKRLKIDLPVRVGQRLAFVDYEGASRLSKEPIVYELRIDNLSTGKPYEVNSKQFIVAALSPRSHEDFTLPVTIGWGLSLFLCLSHGIGLLGVAPLAWRHMRVRAIRLEKSRAIREVVEGKVCEVLALVDAEAARLAPAVEAQAGPQPRRGTAA